MTFRGKRYRQAAEQTGQGSFYAVDEALALVKKTASAKFDETVDVSINLGVNAKKIGSECPGRNRIAERNG